MQDDLLNDTLEKHEIFVDYKKNFKNSPVKKTVKEELFKKSSFYKAELKEKSKDYKKLLSDFLESEEYKDLEQEEYRKQFISFAKEIEKDKLNTFIQIESNNILILQSPPDKEGNKSNKAKIVEFLGYDWSNRKGDEGIKYVVDKSSDIGMDDSVDTEEDDADITESINSIKYIKTPLYNPKDDYDYTKYAFALRKHICEQCSKRFSFDFETSEKLNKFFVGDEQNLHYAKLSDMLDFSRTEFDKSIKLNQEKRNRSVFDSKYPLKILSDLLVKINGNQTKIREKDILLEGKTPVITQESEKVISGFSNIDKYITDLPLIVFGDHSCAFKYVDFPFIRGADGTLIVFKYLKCLSYLSLFSIGVINR